MTAGQVNFAACFLAFLPMAALAQTASGPAVTAGSRVDGISVSLLDMLPNAPATAGQRDRCDHLLVQPDSPAARSVAEKGWAVTADMPFGPYQAVSFVGRMEPATSGTCDLSEGNVGIFSGGDLVAIVYMAPDQIQKIGRVVPFGDGGLRIWNGDVLPAPLADIRLAPRAGISVIPLAQVDELCGGAAAVPFIYGQPIDAARKMLMESGWAPVDQTASGNRISGVAKDLAEMGIVEVDDCSGTGFGFCGYEYRGLSSTLSVVTVGETASDGSLPVVSGYGVRCGS
ncbi:MAG: hypothetical protein ACRCSU_09820 [Paracoccaceae bacterium]